MTDATKPVGQAEADASGDPEKYSPVRHMLNRAASLARFLRIKLAHLILLPELTFDQAHDLRATVRYEGRLSRGYVLMCALSAGIATLGLLQSSTAVVIGAMLISPLMSPIAALGFGFASLDGKRIKEAVRVVAVGAAIGILTGVLLTWISPIRNATPEILARTQPTLLDLAIALLSGIAGGYATVIGKGGTAIGVAIATALMPPLAVLGYGIGVLQIRFALGALLLFLTNLAAITLAFALVARISGAARPIGHVEWTPRYTAVLIGVFLLLATPLSMTLMKLKHEASIRSAARSAIIAACGGAPASLAQIDVQAPMFGDASVTALVIAPNYTANAANVAEAKMQEIFGEKISVNLQQVLAADWQSQTRAMVDAAMERTVAGIAADVPPFDSIRKSIGLPTRALWSDRAQRLVYVEPMPAPDWILADYRDTERRVTALNSNWTVRIVPPPQQSLAVALGEGAPEDAVPVDLAIWALQRWGLGSVRVDGVNAANGAALVKSLETAGINANVDPIPIPVLGAEAAPSPTPSATPTPTSATIRIYPQSPTEKARAIAEAGPEAAPDQ